MVGTVTTWADFTDFKLILNNQEGTLLTADEIAEKKSVEFGFVVAADGTVTRVDKDAAECTGTVKGGYHSEHGLTNFSMTVKVEGSVKVGMGTCAWGGDVKINGTSAFNTNNGTCWHNDHANNIAYGHYTGEAGTITISGGSYTPFVSVEAETVKSNAVAFSLGSIECECLQLPEGKEVIAGETISIPVNHALYKNGYTLTGWTDGTNTYNIGSSFAPTADVTLTPVFTENKVSLADRSEAVTLKWDFQTKNGAPTLAYQNKDGLIYVTQATVNGETIDVKLDFSTNPGKVANANWNDWCQMNPGTKFTIPSCKGAVVSIEAYSAPTTTTIDGQTDYTAAGNTISYTVGNPAEAIDIVIGDGSYYRYIQTVLPVVETPGGKTYKDELTTAFWAMDATDNVAATTAPADAISMTSLNTGDLTITGMGSCTDGDAKAVSGVSLVKFKPAGTTKEVEWSLRPAAGLTFTPTKISGYCNRYGTDADNCVVLTMKTDEGASEAIATFTALRNGKTTAQKPYDATAKYMFEIELTAEQQAALTTTGILSLVGKVGVNEGKELGYGQIKIEGTVSGTIADVNKYTVSIAAAPEEGGSVSIYPKSEEYTENDEVQLTATENFGYDFVNWTNAAGEEVSTEAKCKVTVTADETYTANFVKVETYALDLTIDGGANDYMVSLNPEPVVVDGKKMYEEGTKVTISASENPIISFNNWSDGQTSKEIVMTMDGYKAITAVFSAVDFIVGWDFMKAGNNGRSADFAATDNDDVSLVLRDAEGNTFGWLDKSQFGAGGYEGRPGGVNWKNDVAIGTTYWQTKVNAEAFTDIKIQTAMVYNYNAYQTYNVDASIDGENWETVGSINMPGTKHWTDLIVTLDAKYNNQKELYFRWIADKSSNIDGSTSANDGACIGATYITGTAKLIDDGVAPVLVSSVPADKATGASANGKVVLTFDEKVKVAENATATLGNKTLTPVVSGKTVAFEYKGLEYSTEYTFSLPANSVADLTDNYLNEAINITFSTKTKPEIERGIYDVVIDDTDKYFNPLTDEEKGKLLAEAIATANSRADQTKRFRIFIFPGKYIMPGTGGKTVGGDGKEYDDPRTYLTGSNVSIIGVDYENTIITNVTPDATWDNGFGPSCPLEGIGNADVIINSGTGNYFQGVTIKTSMGDAHGRDIAFQDKGNKTIFKDSRLWGYQDTYVSNSNKSRYYFEGGVIRGRTDYICGKGDVWFEQVTFQQVKSGYLAVPSVPTKYGYILNSCTIKGETSDVDGNYTLGRPWGSGTPIALYINTKMEAKPSAIGWNEMSGGWPARFAEYNSVTASGTTIDLSNRKKTFGDHENCNNPILTAAEASEYSIAKVMGEGDDWDPTAATEQASAPTNAYISKDAVISWDDSKYVLGWMLFYQLENDSEIVPFGYAIENSLKLDVDDAKAKSFANMTFKQFGNANMPNDININHMYVAGVNEMGGIGELTEITLDPVDAIHDIKKEVKNTNKGIYNIAGQKVNENYKGIVINNGKKVIK